jgi:lipid-binding SYLF domain-containing protein
LNNSANDVKTAFFCCELQPRPGLRNFSRQIKSQSPLNYKSDSFMKFFRSTSRAKCFLGIVLFAGAAIANSANADTSRQDARLAQAARVLNEMQASRDQNVPVWMLERAYGVVIVPDVIKVGLGVGGRRGNGVLVIRHPNGQWSNPVFINLTGGSFGLQMGVQSADVLLVFTSRESIDGIVGGKVTLGADASVAAGPVGRQTAAGTDVGFTAQVYSYSRTKGLFAGIALDGSAVTIDSRSNAAYYNRQGVLASEIIANKASPAPASAQAFIASLDRMLGAASPMVAQPATPSVPAPAQSSSAPATSKPADSGQLTTHPLEDTNPGAEPPL